MLHDWRLLADCTLPFTVTTEPFAGNQPAPGRQHGQRVRLLMLAVCMGGWALEAHLSRPPGPGRLGAASRGRSGRGCISSSCVSRRLVRVGFCLGSSRFCRLRGQLGGCRAAGSRSLSHHVASLDACLHQVVRHRLVACSRIRGSALSSSSAWHAAAVAN